MLTALEVVEKYFLDVRAMILELAAFLDRYDRARAQAADSPPEDPRMELLYQALEVLVDRRATPNRVERLLMMFSDPAE
ncbi:MAG: hypothetical protein NZ602_03130 [Thermoguttaceae bacterium]|nr:hypothetical protein [Thermoguttaceae bacterium]MDW8037366.1 hypothetical protein [Thermoguttaceae bacterium]